MNKNSLPTIGVNRDNLEEVANHAFLFIFLGLLFTILNCLVFAFFLFGYAWILSILGGSKARLQNLISCGSTIAIGLVIVFFTIAFAVYKLEGVNQLQLSTFYGVMHYPPSWQFSELVGIKL